MMVLYGEPTAGLKTTHYIGINMDQDNQDNQTTQSSGAQKTILCIEDERFISDLYARALTNAGYDVMIVDDGELGLHHAVNGNFDIILLDIMLPTMNGVDMLYKMKSPHVVPPMKSKIIITTNLDQKEDVRKKVEELADGYLIKAEITPKELVEYIQQLD
jgi:DNA-binding response OmpR family regulator